MKKILSILTAVILTASVFAHPPEKMSYQSVIRNSSNQLITSHTIGMKISILQGSATGAAVYVETQTPSSNANGLVNIEIGGGTIVTGTFSGIDWSAGSYFIKTETDPTGGTNYTITGTSQLLSVPYALYSKSTANGFAPVYSETDTRPVLYDNGNIGIGTANNEAKLNINGRTVIGPGQDTWGSQISIDASSLENGKLYQLTSSGGNASEGQGKLIIGCNGKGNIMVMDPNLNVGIGTVNPVSKLDVNGEINVNSNKITNVANPVNTNDAANKAYVDAKTAIHYVGESYGGGIVFYVYDKGQHGLIAATADQNTSMRWNAGTPINTMAFADGVGAGKTNTALIIASQGYGDGATYAARVCNEYSVTVDGVTYGDWYLPSKYELNLLYTQRVAVGGFASTWYWSSNEYSVNDAWGQLFDNDNLDGDSKNGTGIVRAVRAF
jgi:hypothetical protein